MHSAVHYCALALLLACTVDAVSDDVFCGRASCYELLGLTRDASARDVRRAYHRLSRQFHPDKVSERERAASTVRFREVATAYEVLINEDSRREYDHVLDHPEEYLRNRYRYYNYRMRSSMKVPLWLVVSTLVVLVHVLDWAYWKNRRAVLMKRIKEDPRVQTRARQAARERVQREQQEREERKEKALQEALRNQDQLSSAERKKLRARSKKSSKKGSRRDAEPYIEVTDADIWSVASVAGDWGRDPTWGDLLCLRLFKGTLDRLRWMLLYNVLMREYSREDKIALVCSRFRMHRSSFDEFDDWKQDALVELELWRKEQLDQVRDRMLARKLHRAPDGFDIALEGWYNEVKADKTKSNT